MRALPPRVIASVVASAWKAHRAPCARAYFGARPLSAVRGSMRCSRETRECWCPGCIRRAAPEPTSVRLGACPVHAIEGSGRIARQGGRLTGRVVGANPVLGLVEGGVNRSDPADANDIGAALGARHR